MRELLTLGNVALFADCHTKIGDGFSLAGRDDAHPIGGGFFEGKGETESFEEKGEQKNEKV